MPRVALRAMTAPKLRAANPMARMGELLGVRGVERKLWEEMRRTRGVRVRLNLLPVPSGGNSEFGFAVPFLLGLGVGTGRQPEAEPHGQSEYGEHDEHGDPRPEGGAWPLLVEGTRQHEH